jgi:hypothetical protein
MAVSYYQNTTSQGRRIGTELVGLMPAQVATKMLDILADNESAFNIFLGMNDLSGGVRQIGNHTYLVHADEHVKVVTLLTAAVASGGTTWNVTAGTGKCCAPWDILWNRTRNLYAQVVSVSTDAVTVLDNIDSGTASASQIGDEVWNLGNRLEEGTGVPNMKSTEPNSETNYIMKIITPIIFTEDALEADSFYPTDFNRQWAKGAKQHMRSVDLAVAMGGKARLAVSTSQTAPTYKGNYFGQSVGWLTWHRTYADTTHWITETDMNESEFLTRMVEPAFLTETAGSDEKVCLGPIQFATARSQWKLSKTRYWSEDKMKGSKSGYPVNLRYSRMETDYGLVDFVRYWPFESTVAGGTHFISIIDKKRIGHCRFKGRPKTRKKDDVTKTGDQIIAGYYEDMLGTVFRHPNVHVTAKVNTFS